MLITARRVTDDGLFRRACEMTLPPGKVSRVPYAKMLMAEHSPIRTIMFWIECLDIKTKCSVHLVRHKIWTEHFVRSNRTDRGGAGDDVVTRETPVNHGLFLNAQALINMARKRLCLHADKDTLAIMAQVRKAVRDADSDLAHAMVPECVYRGFCPEPRQCKAGQDRVIRSYAKGNPLYGFRAS